MTADNRIVQGLWIGSCLSNIELLTIISFINHGHIFHLYVYAPIEHDLPPGVVICDANEIIPAENVFSYNNASQMGHGKGSYAGFSDIFRYKLLYLKGGWWVDMDVTCLAPFDFNTPYFFRDHHNLKLVGNVMKVPQGSEVMKQCYQEATIEVTAQNTDWHKPIEILEKNVSLFGLDEFIYSSVSNLDLWRESTCKFVQKNTEIPGNYYFIHWQNEAWRHLGLKKTHIPYYSTLGKLMSFYGLLPAKLTIGMKIMNRIYHSRVGNNLRMLDVWT